MKTASLLTHPSVFPLHRTFTEPLRLKTRASSPTRTEYYRRHATWLVGISIAGLTLVSGSRFGASSIVGETMFVVSVFLSAIAGSGRIWSKIYIAGYKSQALVTEGPYSMCRNPLYLCSAVGIMGIGLATCTITIPAVLATAFFVYFAVIIADEEKRLAAMHGAEFEAYRARTPRIIPDFSRLREPARYVICPRSLRRHLADVIWFPVIVAAIHVGVHLHDRGLLPAWWWLY